MSYAKIIESGIRASHYEVCDEDRVWSRYSHDKVDIGEELAKVIRTLNKALPLGLALRALSIGSSNEPQFRILESSFRGGLYLLDIDACALNIVKERIKRQRADHVTTVKGDYNKIFSSSESAKRFLRRRLSSARFHLVALYHSLYYCQAGRWLDIFKYLYRDFLMPVGSLHAVMMSPRSRSHFTTTWLYNHFAGKFFGVAHNDQDLTVFSRELKKEPLFRDSQVMSRTNRVYFNVDDFEKFMAAVWMVLLYPQVHKYTLKQREEITEFIYKNFWRNKKPLLQEQDHLVVYKGMSSPGLI